MRIGELIQSLQDMGEFERLRMDAAAQFGRPDKSYYGTTLLPEQLRDANAYSESQIRYQTTLANAGSSYSPAQLSTGGRIFGEFKVSFGNTNIADQIAGREYDSLMKLLRMADDPVNANSFEQAAITVLNFLDRNIREPHLGLNELYRWQAIIDKVVRRRGSNGYSEDVNYPTPAGHSVTIGGGTTAAPAGWYSTTTSYDPYADFLTAKRFLAGKGYKVDRTVSNFTAAYTFLRNPNIINRVGGSTFIDASGGIGRSLSSVTLEAVNRTFNADQLPSWDIYDETYTVRSVGAQAADQNGIITGRYLDRTFNPGDGRQIPVHPVVLLCRTGRDESIIDFGDRSSLPNGGITLPNTLGYYGIGTVAAQPAPGRHIWQTVEEKHPGGLYAEGVQEGLPVITEPEAIYVMWIREPVPPA
jgi:hypothetical protein